MDDIFMDKSKLEKLIELGIYGEDMVDKVRNYTRNADASKATPTTTATAAKEGSADATRREEPQSQRVNSSAWRPPNRPPNFKPRDGSDAAPAYQWREAGGPRNRARTPSPIRRFRDKERDQMQLKVSRGEMERKMTVDYMRNKRQFGDNSNRKPFDNDFRRADIDSRARDIDQRSRELNANRNNINNPLTASSTVIDDFKSEDFRGPAVKRGKFDNFVPTRSNFFDTKREASQQNDTIADIDAFIKGCSTTESKEPEMLSKKMMDIDDFIKQCEMKLMPNSSRGRPMPQKRQPFDQKSQPNVSRNNADRNINLGANESRFEPTDSFNRNIESFGNNDSNINYRHDTDVLANQDKYANNEPTDSSKHIEVLENTVKELSKSNLYCEFCKCNLSSLVEVNAHIETVLHKQNMALTNSNANENKTFSVNDNSNAANKQFEPNLAPKKVKGMAILMDMISNKREINLKTLTDLDSYDIQTDEEAAVAKELAQLLTNQLLHYKMNLMPSNVKEALKSQGIGLLNH